MNLVIVRRSNGDVEVLGRITAMRMLLEKHEMYKRKDQELAAKIAKRADELKAQRKQHKSVLSRIFPLTNVLL